MMRKRKKGKALSEISKGVNGNEIQMYSMLGRESARRCGII